MDRGYTGQGPAEAAGGHGIRLEVVRHSGEKKGFVLLYRWVVKCSFAWTVRFRRLAHDYERLADTVAVLHLVAFVCLMLDRAIVVALGAGL